MIYSSVMQPLCLQDTLFYRGKIVVTQTIPRSVVYSMNFVTK